MSYTDNRKALSLPEQQAGKTSIKVMFDVAKEWKLNPNKRQNQRTIKNIIIRSIKNN